MTKAASTEVHMPLDLSDVRKTLRALWADEALRDVAVVRARTHNLVICAPPGVSDAVTDDIIELSMAQPGRVIVVEVAEEGDPHLEASVSAYCRPEGGKQLCGELITLRAYGSAREEAHSAVVSLLEPDLPVSVWWQDAPPSGDHLFDEVTTEADRVFFDSDGFGDPTDNRRLSRRRGGAVFPVPGEVTPQGGKLPAVAGFEFLEEGGGTGDHHDG